MFRRRPDVGARRRRGAAHLLSPRRRLEPLGRRADHAARRRPHRPSTSGSRARSRRSTAICSSACRTCSASTRRCRSCSRRAVRADEWLRKPNSAPLCSAATRRSTACSPARSPTCTSCASTSTRSAEARHEPSPPREAARATRKRAGVAVAVRREQVPLRRVSWRPSYRLIPSRYPTVGLYDAIADPADLDVVFAIEALANPRIRDELGELTLVPREERLTGPGATPVMAAFTHLNPEARASPTAPYGVYYAAHSLETAIAEVSHHRARLPAPHRRAGDRRRHAPHHRERRGGAARPARARRRGRQRADRYRRRPRPRRLRAVAGARPAPARGAELGHPLSERSPCRRRVRRHLPAARVAPRQGGGAPGAALGRHAHHALVREAASRMRSTSDEAARAAAAVHASCTVSLARLRHSVTALGRRCSIAHGRRSNALTSLLVFAHLLAASLALGAIVATDLRLLSKLAQDRIADRAAERIRRPDRRRLARRPHADRRRDRAPGRARASRLPRQSEAAGQAGAGRAADHQCLRPAPASRSRVSRAVAASRAGMRSDWIAISAPGRRRPTSSGCSSPSSASRAPGTAPCRSATSSPLAAIGYRLAQAASSRSSSSPAGRSTRRSPIANRRRSPRPRFGRLSSPRSPRPRRDRLATESRGSDGESEAALHGADEEQ